jgi:hypothetical protein
MEETREEVAMAYYKFYSNDDIVTCLWLGV